MHTLMDLRNVLKEAAKDLVSHAKKHRMKSKYTYARILADLESSDAPIYSIESVKGAGVKTRRFFAKYLSKNAEAQCSTAESVAENISLVSKKQRTICMHTNVGADVTACQTTPCGRTDVSGDVESLCKPRSREWERISKAMKERDCTAAEEGSGDGMATGFVVSRNMCEDTCASREKACQASLIPECALHVKVNAKEAMCCTEEYAHPAKSAKNETETAFDRVSYMPGYRTGAYAILKVLDKEDGLTRNQICFRAACYSDTEFNPKLRYSAWSAMRTLISKGLVFNEDRPVRYYISELGRHIAQKLPNDAAAAKEKPQRGIVLIIDSREMKSKKMRSFFQKELSDLGVSVETTNLEVGDFLWVKDDAVLNYIVERKCGADFVSSITDGRLLEQMERLKACGIRNVFYVIEGLRKRHMARIGSGFGQTMLSMLKMQNVTVIETENARETVNVLNMIDSMIRRKDLLVSGRAFKEGVVQESSNGLCDEVAAIHKNLSNMSLGEIKLSSYESFMCKGAKNRGFDAREFFYRSLLCVKGMSHERSRAVAAKYGTVRSFVNASHRLGFFEELCTIVVKGQVLARALATRVCTVFGITFQKHSSESEVTAGDCER
eukprot:jgi/Antlo1/1415/1382